MTGSNVTTRHPLFVIHIRRVPAFGGSLRDVADATECQ
jgi:hypothetical protein